jgi:hypothetical protein
MESLLRDLIDQRILAQYYVKSDAHSSYRHWWSHLGYLLDMEYDHLLHPDRPHRRYMQRYRYTRHTDHREWVEHTVVLPTGKEITYQWQSAHSPGWRCRGVDIFREKRSFTQHGVEKKIPDQNSLDWREHKQFAKDKGKRKKCQRCCGRWMKTQVNRENRRANKKLIYSGDWDEIRTLAEPRDKWRWD